MEFQRGDILTDGGGAILSRVLIRTLDSTWLIDLRKGRSVLPYKKSTLAIQLELENGELQFHVASDEAKDPSDADKRYARAVVRRLKPVLDRLDNLMTSAGRMDAYHFLSESDKKLTYKTFIRMLRDYLLAGGVESAIVSGRVNNGRSAVDRSEGLDISLNEAINSCRERALQLARTPDTTNSECQGDWTVKGMPRKRRRPMRPTRFLVDGVALMVFKKYFSLMRKEGTTVGRAYNQMCIEVFSVVDAFGSAVPIAENCIPSRIQFKNWYAETPYRTRRENQVGKDIFETSERAMLGNEFSAVLNVGDVGSADATIWNVGLRSRLLTREIIGPAVVFRIRCKKSGMCLGLSVSLENASWNHFASAIQNCYEDKVAFCAKYGVTISEEEWPIKGLPSTIEADCGESDNTMAEAVCRAIGMGFKNITGGRPDIKPGSESDFNTLQVRMNGLVPGALVRAWQARGNHEWRVKAVLDLDEFIAVLIHLELRKMRTPRDDLNLPAEMIADGCDTSPLSVWNWYKANRGGGLRSVNPTTTTLALLNREQARVTERGILFRGLLYTAGPLVTEDAYARARRYGRETVDVGFDPRLVDDIFLFRKQGGALRCNLNVALEHQTTYIGKTFREVQSLETERRRLNATKNSHIRHADLNVDEQINHITRRGEVRTAEAPAAALPPATQKGRLREARQAEKNILSPAEALQRQPAFTSGDGVPPTQNVVLLRPASKATTRKPSSALASLMKSIPSTKDGGTKGE